MSRHFSLTKICSGIHFAYGLILVLGIHLETNVSSKKMVCLNFLFFFVSCHSCNRIWYGTNHIICKHLAFNGYRHNHGKSKGITIRSNLLFTVMLFSFHSRLLISWMFEIWTKRKTNFGFVSILYASCHECGLYTN